MEHKTSPAFVTKIDELQGIVETVFAVFGNLDLGNDIIHPGAFAKTFVERGLKVKLLDLHNTDSVLRVLGKPLAFRELTADELPTDLLKECPEATGGAWAQVQFNMKTANGHDAFQHFRAGDIDEWSFAYDSLQEDFSEIDKINVRNLRELKLYEISPVVWGMNPATTTTSAKEHEKSGKAVNLSEQVESIRAAFSNQYDSPSGPWDYWVSTVYDEYIIVEYDGEDGQEWYQVSYAIVDDKPEFAPRGEWIQGDYTFVPGSKAAGSDDDTTHPAKGAGPDGAPSTDDDLLKIIQIRQHQITLLEV